jgi:hypothetical protein
LYGGSCGGLKGARVAAKRFRVVLRYGDGSTEVRANWFRITWVAHHAIFYRGLRKVAYVQNVRLVKEVEGE